MATPQQQLDRAIRNDEIVAAIIEGGQFAEVGRQFGISAQRTHQIWKRELAKRPVPRIDEHRRKELALIEYATKRLFEVINDPASYRKDKVDALRVLGNYSEARRKLLGLDAPLRREVTVLTEDTVDAAIRKVAEEHAEQARELDAAERAARARGDL